LLLVLLEWVILKLKFILLSNKGERAWNMLGTILAILIIGVRRSILPWSSLEFFRDFYFRALGSLVVLSFSQLVSFSSVLSKPLSKTLTSAGMAGCPMGQQLWPLSAD
jgi:predicted membrane channel-forming protein YqfA (hemolysin III family)